MKRYVIFFLLLATGVLSLVRPVQAGDWTSVFSPVERSLDCIDFTRWDNCILLGPQKKSKKAMGGDHWRGGKRVYPTGNNAGYDYSNYKAPKMYKPTRAMRDERIK